MSELDLEATLGPVLRSATELPDAEALASEVALANARTLASLRAERRAPRAARAEGRAPGGPTAAFIVYAAPWGDVHVAASATGIVALELRSTTEAFVEAVAQRTGGAVVPDQDGIPGRWRELLDRARSELDEYFAGDRTTFDLAVDLRGVSTWDRRVLEGAAALRFGEVTSYGRLARRIGQPRAARAVGGALGRNPIPIVIPCHRILSGDGTLGGYGGGGHGSRAAMLEVKRTLLALEGVGLPAPVPALVG